MHYLKLALIVALVVGAAFAGTPSAQQPPTNASPGAPGAPGATGATGAPGATGAQPGGRGGRGGGRGGVQIMTITTTAWPDGGQIPAKHTQVGEEASPALSWSNVPEGTQSFVLIFHDVDAAIGNGLDDVLHWMLWNIPGTARSLPEKLPAMSELPDRTRQISGTGPYYRGPGALASGPTHHYVLELYALDTMLDNIQAVGQSPAQTRAAVMAAMATHVRAKGVYVGLFKRQ